MMPKPAGREVRFSRTPRPTLLHSKDAARTGALARNFEAMARRAGGWLYRSRRRLATVAVCLLATWLGFRVVSGPNGWMVYHQKRAEYQRLQQEVQELQQQNEGLERRINALKSDPKAIEKEAREQLRYAKPGEVVYVLPEQKPAVVQPPASGVAQKNEKP